MITDPQSPQMARPIAQLMAALVFVLAMTALAGLTLGTGAPIRFPTAIVLLLNAVALYALTRAGQPGSGPWQRLLRAAAGGATLLALANFLQNAAGIDFRVFGAEPMALTSAISGLLSGLALLLGPGSRRQASWSQALAVGVALLGGVGLVAYTYGVSGLFRAGVFASANVEASLTFVLLAVGIMLATPKGSRVRLWTGGGSAARLLRRFLPLAVLAPWLAGLLLLLLLQVPAAVQPGLPVTLALVTSACMIILIAGLLSIVTMVSLDDRQRAVIVRSIGDGVIACDRQGRVIELNPVAEALTGWSLAEAKGQPIGTVFNSVCEITRQPAEMPMASVLATGRSVGLADNTALIARDGTERSIADSCTPLQDDHGEVIGAVLVFRDLTEARASRAAAAQAQTQLDSSPVITALLDQHGRILAVNEAWRRFGRENGADGITTTGIGLDYLAVCRQAGEPEGAAVADGISQLLAGQLPDFRIDYSCHSPKAWRRFRLLARRAGGDSPAVVVSHSDVTAQWQAEQRLFVQMRMAAMWASATSFPEAVRQLLETLINALEWDFGGLWLAEAGTLRLVHVSKRQTDTSADLDAVAGALSAADASAWPSRALENGAGIWLTDLSEAGSVGRFLADRLGQRTGLAFPVRCQDDAGVIILYSSVQHEPDTALLDLLTGIRQQMTEIGIRAHAQRALKRSESLFRSLFESSGDAVVVFNMDGFIDCNAATLRVFGCGSREAFLRTPPGGLSPPLQPSGEGSLDLADQMVANAATQGSVAFEWIYRRLDTGQDFPAEVVLSQVELEGERLLQATIRDISEKRDLQASMMQIDRMASMGTLASGLAHEINNPMAVVTANLDLTLNAMTELSQRVPLDPELLADLGDAQAAARRVSDIVRDLRTFSRVESPTSTLLDVCQVLDATICLIRHEIRDQARLVRQFDEVPAVEASESRLGQVFLNLLLNAAQAMTESRPDVNEIRIATRLTAAGEVLVEIADTGCGMSPEVRRRLFEPFFTTKGVGAGTGLGMPICLSIIDDLGGRIEVESAVGQGTTFRIYLPAAVAPAVPLPAPPAPPVWRRGRVLVIDDEPTIGRAITRVLSAEHDVLATMSAKEALGILQAGERFDVILCDLMMPEMTGEAFYHELGRVAPDQVGRVVFLSGGAFTPSTIAFLDGVPNHRMAKPFSQSQLRAAVNERIR